MHGIQPLQGECTDTGPVTGPTAGCFPSSCRACYA